SKLSQTPRPCPCVPHTLSQIQVTERVREWKEELGITIPPDKEFLNVWGNEAQLALLRAKGSRSRDQRSANKAKATASQSKAKLKAQKSKTKV
ncbi:hypothetical protein BaRGS_00038207, partial [Batillaria attramentaria]